MTAFSPARSPASSPARRANPLGGGAWHPSQLGDAVLARFLDGKKYNATTLNGLQVFEPQEPYGTLRAPRAGRAWLMDGADDYATLGAKLTNGPSQLSVFAWVKFTTTATRIAASESTGVGDHRCWTLGYTSGRIYVTLNSVGSFGSRYETVANVGTEINDNAWHHIGFVYSSGTLAIYRDGVAVAHTPFVGTLPTGALSNRTNHFGIGASDISGTPASFLIGSIRDVRVFNVSKTVEQVAAISAGDNDAAGLLAQYPCNEESGTIGYDIGPNARHLTLTNITQATFHAADTGVTRNRNNVHGYRLSGSVYIPARLGSSLAADGNALTHSGKSPYPATVDVPCITGDRSSVYVNLGAGLINGSNDYVIEFTYFHNRFVNAMQRIFDIRNNAGTQVQGMLADATLPLGYSAGSLVLGGVAQAIAIPNSLTDQNWHRITIQRTGNAVTTTCLNLHTGTSVVSSPITPDNFTTSEFMYWLAAYNLNGTPTIANPSQGRIADLRITTGGVTKHFPLQDGPGSSNTNRNIAWVASDGTSGVISNAIVNGTVANIWANRVPGFVRDHCIEYGGRISTGNALTVPEEFDSNIWTKSNATVTANQAVAPNGTNTADLIQFTATNGNIFRTPGHRPTVVPGNTYTLSVWMRAVSGTFNLKLATTNTFSWLHSFVSDELVLTEEWQRYSLTFTVPNDGNWSFADFVIGDESKTGYSLPATGSIYAWGAQLNLGSSATPYEQFGDSGVFVPGKLDGSGAADGNAITLVAGKHGNPYSRLNMNPFTAAEYNGRNVPTALAPAGSLGINPSNSAFRRTKPDGDDRFIVLDAAATDPDLSDLQNYTG